MLITLAIIGIVAALTIPTLVANYREKVLINKVKKSYSQMNNALQLYMAHNNCANLLCLFDVSKSSLEVNENLMTVFSGAKLCTKSSGECKSYLIKENKPTTIVDGAYVATYGMQTPRLLLKDGSTIGIQMRTECKRIIETEKKDENGNPTGEIITTTVDACGYLYLDTNNKDLPNQIGVDVFVFYVLSNGKMLTASQKLLDNIIQNNKLEYTDYNFGDPVE